MTEQPPILPRPSPAPLRRPQGARRGTPPALFPSTLGLIGVGLAWRRAAAALPDAVGPAAEVYLGAVTLVAVVALALYARKALARPSAVTEDLRVLPGRAGVAAAVLIVYALAAVLAPYGPAVARALIATGAGLHLLFVAALVRTMVTGPAEGRVVTPAWHLAFVGFIVAGLGATPAGWAGLAAALVWPGLAIAVMIWTVSLWQIATRIPPAPLRPLLAIHVAPASILATVAADTGLSVGLGLGVAVGAPLAAFAVALGLVLLVTSPWLTVSGFSPLWGAFTFPMAALSGALIAQGWLATGLAVLVLASVAVPWIALRVWRMWAAGTLGPRTNAAIA